MRLACDGFHRRAVVDHDLAARGQVEQPFGAHPGELAARRLDRQPQYVGNLLAAEWQFEPALRFRPAPLPRQALGHFEQERRSEEHTSELQSLMRIPYAVL